MSEDLLTGERTWPDIPRENYWFMRHLACYRWAAEWIASTGYSGTILDAGSGEGYGAAAIAATCSAAVVAVELDALTARHSYLAYTSVDHVQANLVALPFCSRTFAAAISLQVIEHIWDPVAYLRELDRCTRGPVLLSTPNRPVHSPHLAREENPDNPFHVREFDARELLDLLACADTGRTPTLLGLCHAPRLRLWEAEHGSLAQTLIHQPDSAPAADFARSVASTDFHLEPLDAGDLDSALLASHVQDLVAIW